MKSNTAKMIFITCFIFIITAIAFVYINYGVPHIYFDKTGIAAVGNAANESEVEESDAGYVKALKAMLDQYFDGDISEHQMTEGILKGVLGSMDAYTEYYTKAEADLYFSDTEGKYSGIGISIDKIGESIVITKVYPTSPADKEGLTPGDEIIKVDDETVLNMTTDEVANRIRGNVGTKVKLGIMKSSSIAIAHYELTRSVIAVDPIEYYVTDDVGYIRIDTFNSNSGINVTNILDEFDKKNIKKVILDLRNNIGGIIDQAVSLANQFVPEGLIATVDFKSPDLNNISYYSYLKNPKYQLVVLVNGRTKSSAELFAGAVQDTNAGKVIGTKTFGKAKVQQTLALLSPEASEKYERKFGVKLLAASDLYQKYHVTANKDDIIGYAKITVGRYYTPKGRMIDQSGITPDIIINDPVAVNGVSILNIRKLTNKAVLDLNDKGLDVYHAECILKLQGYDVGSPDAVLDKKTVELIRAFQKKEGIRISGKLDGATQEKLNDAYKKLTFECDTQYKKAVEVLNNLD